jgi:hypothetical protein
VDTATLIQRCTEAEQFAAEAGIAFDACQPGDPDRAGMQELWLLALADLRAYRAHQTKQRAAKKARAAA